MPADRAYSGLRQFVNTTSINYLANPQNLSAYSYVNNNPLRYTDPTGEFLDFNYTRLGPVDGIPVPVGSDGWS
jgi:hypothetical protein